MPVRATLEARIETVQGMEAALNGRFAEAALLVTRGHLLGGSYLAGYVAEIALKTAALRLDGARATDAVRGRLVPLTRRAQVLIGAVDHEHFHSLLFWGLALAAIRRQLGLDAATTKQLAPRAQRLHQHWAVAMRYWDVAVRPEDAKSVLQDAGWLRANAHALWRS